MTEFDQKIFCILLVVLAGSLVRGDGDEEKDESCLLPMRRLPENIRVRHYDLHIEPSLEELKFKGRVAIDLTIEESQGKSLVANNKILFHADKGIELDEKNIKLVLDDGREIKTEKVCRDPEYQLVALILSEDLLKNKVKNVQLLISFFGDLRDDMFGFYKSFYLSEQNQSHYLATTQFEATEARKAFPCFDEPLFKATFDLTVVHEPNLIALSNTEVVEEEILQDGRKLVKFARTPLMSTYLLAYVIGEFDYIEQLALGGRLRVRVYATPGESKKGQFALDTACRAIHLMEEYFGIEFPLNKIDLIGIPDFYHGAMENWGLITFKEIMLLTDEADTAPMDLVEVAYVIVHELAHQWFGNLVTMRWWNDLWLNEGFATWFSYHMLEQVHPQFDTKSVFYTSIQLVAMDWDARRKTHAIRKQSEVETNEQIFSLFNSITYKKSASLLRFLHNDYLGPEAFKESLRHYMAKHKYGNTVTDDLTSSMEEVSKLSVKPILDSWTTQAGHPVLILEYKSRNLMTKLYSRNTQLVISQKRFEIDMQSKEEQHWIVPVSMMVVAPGKQELISFTLSDDEARTEMVLPSWFRPGKRGHWLKLNHDFSGFYRTYYPQKLLELLEEPIRKKSMAPADRLNVLNEAHALWKANYTSGSDYIQLLTWFKEEDNGVVLVELVTNLIDLQYEARPEGREGVRFDLKFESFTKRLLEGLLRHPILSDLKAVTDPLEEAAVASVLSLLISYRHEGAINLSLKMLDKAGGNVNKIRVALRKPVYMATACSEKANEQFFQLLELLKSTKMRNERTRLIITLATTPYEIRQKELTEYLLKTYIHLKVDFPWTNVLSLLEESKKNHKERVEYVMSGSKSGTLIQKGKKMEIESAIDRCLASWNLI